MSSSDIRQAFLDYFQAKEHHIVPSSSLVPTNDPTLLFVNAGMVQFKETFLGLESRPYQRAVSVQRCVRAGGKHNDLDQVGYTARHHTLFEMLGNFSFGDYFKREAIQYAWTFLTEVLKLPEEKLWVTVFEEDHEAEKIWLEEMGVSAKRFSRCGEADNFWSMGDTGPCGPCTEIFYDHGPSIAGGPPGSPDQEGDRYVEIWNLVFMQYNRDASGALHLLAKPSVDTGMGLERIAAVMQGVHSNYDTDIFRHLKQAIVKLAQSSGGEAHIDFQHPSLNVIADHVRASAFLMIDDVLPRNEGRGYVLRRIIRRAVRHGHHLKLPMPFLTHLVDALVEVMGTAYPALVEQADSIKACLASEEEQFAKTLENGLTLLNEAVSHLKERILPGEVAFKLYDTYGFPLDLTQDILREQGISVDEQGFAASMQKQRAQSQASQAFKVDYNQMTPIAERSTFEGYSHTSYESVVCALRVEGEVADALMPGTRASVVLNHTPFYAESGGQVGDKGVISSLAGDTQFRVDDTQKVGHAIVHEGELISGCLKLSDKVMAVVDTPRREAIRLNHTATHILHAILRQQLGTKVQQKGSLVDAARARFDFSYDKALSPEVLRAIESDVNAAIRQNDMVETDVMPMDDAVKAGAVALFGEKYSADVRVLTMGELSKELCGGTHAKRTGDIGLFKIISESGIARGVRRIEFVTGAYAFDYVCAQMNTLTQSAALLKASPEMLPEKITQLQEEYKAQTKALNDAMASKTASASEALLDEFQTKGSTRVLIKKLEDIEPKGLRELLDELKSKATDTVIVLVGTMGDKMHVAAHVGRALLAAGAPKAPVFVQVLCGRGGGRDDMAQGGGVVPDDLEQRMSQILELL